MQKLAIILTLSLLVIIPGQVSAMSHHQGRLGIGISNQLMNDITAISFKLQKSRSFALGGVMGISTADPGGGYGAGIKAYKILFDEPQLNFYAAALGALINKKQVSGDSSGFQFDFTLGSEFSFAGIESIGFSFEFGISLNKIDDFVLETVGHNFIAAGIHFYL